MSKQHTPGPWIDVDGRILSEGYVMTGAPIATVHARKKSGMQKSNARLIAAAPLMLAELRSLRTLLKDQLDCFIESVTDPITGLITDTDDRLSAEADQDRLNQIDAVIKLATGDDAPA